MQLEPRPTEQNKDKARISSVHDGSTPFETDVGVGVSN